MGALSNGQKLKPLLKTRLFNILTDEELTSKEGVEKIMNNFVKELGEDYLYTKAAWGKVDRFKRVKGTGIKDFIDEFDARWQEMERSGCGKLSNTFKAFR